VTSSPDAAIVPKPRVFIADDHELVAAGLAQLLAPHCTVVGTANSGEALLAEIDRVHPDVVLLDVSMPPANGLELVRTINQRDPAIHSIIVTLHNDPEIAAEAFRAGASGFILKECAAPELLEAIRVAMGGQFYVTPLMAGGVVDLLVRASEKRPADVELTARQREVLRLLAEGKSMKEAAAVLDVEPRTIAFHKYRMMRQLNIKTSAELVRFAVARKIV
jgi:DNA-binding NarL/FixJ family response regulator